MLKICSFSWDILSVSQNLNTAIVFTPQQQAMLATYWLWSEDWLWLVGEEVSLTALLWCIVLLWLTTSVLWLSSAKPSCSIRIMNHGNGQLKRIVKIRQEFTKFSLWGWCTTFLEHGEYSGFSQDWCNRCVIFSCDYFISFYQIKLNKHFYSASTISLRSVLAVDRRSRAIWAENY